MLNDRLLYELALLDDYKKNHEYFRKYKIIDDDVLKIDFRMVVKNHAYDFYAIFNRYFPNQPIQIIAKTEFFTPHKYKNGAMCLKWGQDNWNKDITFVELLENLYELLLAENPLGKRHGKSESGDLFTFGQQLKRLGSCSILLPYGFEKFKNKEGVIKWAMKDGAYNSLTFIVTDIDEDHIYNAPSDAYKIKYYILPFRRKDTTLSEVKGAIGFNEKNNSMVVFYQDGYADLFLNASKEEDPYLLEYMFKDYEIRKRIEIDDSVFEKRIAIIGIGSVGSRVTLDLARAGFKNFYLVDDDVMLPYNVIRHELTNDNVGEYKVNAIKKIILKEINENAMVETSTLAMTGQESSTSTERFLESCSESSLIIDCTASDTLLLTLSEMTKEKNIPVISGTVIPGGLGNIIIIKKTNDIDLESILASYYEWLSGKTIFAKRVNDYTSTIDDQSFSATMSDCSILSGLIGKAAISILQGKEQELSNITVFSTSNYGDLNETYSTSKIKANILKKTETKYDSKLLKTGREIYENYCSKRNSK